MLHQGNMLRCIALFCALTAAIAFVVVVPPAVSVRPSLALAAADPWTSAGGADNASSGGGYGSIEQIEFKIYPDGRVEETVRGVKGNNCHKVTEKINEALGEVVASEPTEEMFEEEVKVSETLYNKESSSDWDGSSSW
jgi:hypothetical protein